MRRLSPPLPSILALALVLTACADLHTPPPPTIREGVPVVRTVTATHAVGFRPGAAAVDATAALELSRFLEATGVVAGAELRLSVGPNPSAATLARLTAVDTLLARAGFATAAVTQPGQPDGTVRVTAARRVASAPGCPDWTVRAAEDWLNRPSANLGCATAANLASMLVEPGDVAVGRVPGPAMAPLQPPRPPRSTAGGQANTLPGISTEGVGGS